MINSIFIFILAGASLAVGSFYSETWVCFALSLLSAICIAWAARVSLKPKRDFFVFGFVFAAIAFYWLPDTITIFGGMPFAASIAVYIIFCATSALQFVVCAWIYKHLKLSPLSTFGLVLPAAWLASDLVFPRMFPWAIGHSLVVWKDVAAVAEYVGVPWLSAMVIWWGECLVTLFLSCKVKKLLQKGVVFSAVSVSAIVLVLGSLRNADVRNEIATADSFTAGMVQGNLNVVEKLNAAQLSANMERYRKLSDLAVAAGAEIIFWPESVVNQWTPEQLQRLDNTELDPYPERTVPLLFGTLSFRPRDKGELERILKENPELDSPRFRQSLAYHRFNSGFGLDSDGRVTGVYHKQVLMPFGEYVPFSDTFYSLKTLLPQTGDFSPGALKKPLVFSLTANSGGEERSVRASVLICYEDLIPRLAQEAVQGGANLLVNITNDAWYGDTAAPYQHHLLAMWRAIESRRYFLRVTNTGYTAVVDPFGDSYSHLPLFTEAYSTAKVSLLNHQTVYSWIGDTPAWVAVLFIYLLAFLFKFSSRRKKK